MSTRFARPETIDEAVSMMSMDTWTLLSGGTDYYPALQSREPSGNVLDLSGLKTLATIEETADNWLIGARSTWSDLIAKDLPPAFDALKLAAREIGSIQIQNRATLAGNLCNASPAADGVPVLLILDAKIRLQSARGTRTVPLAEFITGNRRTIRASDEILTHIVVPKSATEGLSVFQKLGARKYLVISITMAAIRLVAGSDDTIREAAISVGSCSAVARRLGSLEDALKGALLAEAVTAEFVADHLGALSPIDDIRASAAYRMEASAILLSRLLSSAMKEARK
ncbi:MAG: FAD binding domain-containing protein [Pseudomonadota bacterium]